MKRRLVEPVFDRGVTLQDTAVTSQSDRGYAIGVRATSCFTFYTQSIGSAFKFTEEGCETVQDQVNPAAHRVTRMDTATTGGGLQRDGCIK